MTNVEFETRTLVRTIKKSNEYNQYQRLKKKLGADADLMKKVNEYRRSCFELQAGDLTKDTQKELEKLYENNYELLSDATVNEFLISERRVCRMMEQLFETLTEAINLEIDFL